MWFWAPWCVVCRGEAPHVAAVQAANAAEVAFVADATLARGDAEAERRIGQVDARLGTALDRARTALLGDPATDGGAS